MKPRIQIDGTRKRLFFGKNRRHAEQQLRELEKELEHSTHSLAAFANPHVDQTIPRNPTLEELITRYLVWIKANRAPRTWETNKGLLQPFMHGLVSNLNHTTLADYYAWVSKFKGRGPNGGNKQAREGLNQAILAQLMGQPLSRCKQPKKLRFQHNKYTYSYSCSIITIFYELRQI